MYEDSDKERLLLAVDCIVFGFDGEKLKILLIKRGFEPERGKWSLVGGFLKQNEVLQAAAIRILHRYTGLDNIYMEQVGTFSDIDRDPQERTVSTAYYALINIENHSRNLDHQFSAQWFSVEEAPRLIFDHDRMVRHALKRLKVKAETEPIGFELLPEKFTMLQLQKLYEAIYNVSLDKRNFINKVRSLDILEKLDEKDKTSSRKGSFLYRFDADKYHRAERSRLMLNL
ncbi:ADP-ribose pyrophosphatase YjhB (NUDIX family) [Lewinella aquimaris]|uniref:ADP-ribose pyrophosphatase YjhB (NUDIX family) n=1 Tax=Neolewinella aquimaris TaxID=1835722 RepID=A0A840E9X2_9BACT|nr:NUDIX domain-containing protein [Neolewinella aquimaris]MBB4080743.1 ADP-ribose pyrophosphatase YjhB (NUDIX family) [Neolewinella aquimaris]